MRSAALAPGLGGQWIAEGLYHGHISLTYLRSPYSPRAVWEAL